MDCLNHILGDLGFYSLQHLKYQWLAATYSHENEVTYPILVKVLFSVLDSFQPKAVWSQGQRRGEDHRAPNAGIQADVSPGHSPGPDLHQQVSWVCGGFSLRKGSRTQDSFSNYEQERDLVVGIRDGTLIPGLRQNPKLN